MRAQLRILLCITHRAGIDIHYRISTSKTLLKWKLCSLQAVRWAFTIGQENRAISVILIVTLRTWGESSGWSCSRLILYRSYFLGFHLRSVSLSERKEYFWNPCHSDWDKYRKNWTIYFRSTLNKNTLWVLTENQWISITSKKPCFLLFWHEFWLEISIILNISFASNLRQ